MFCRYCGKQIPEGGACDCPTSKRIQAQNAQRAANPGMNQAAANNQAQQRAAQGQQAGAQQSAVQGQAGAQQRMAQGQQAGAQQRMAQGQQAGAQQRMAQGQQMSAQQRAAQQRYAAMQQKGAVPPQKGGNAPKKADDGGKGDSNGKFLPISFALSVVALILFILLRFVLVDTMMDDTFITGIYPYLMYILPVLAAIAACLMAVFSLQNKAGRKLSMIALAVSIIIAGAVVVTMVAFPYEESYVSSSKDDDEDDDDKDKDEDKDDETDDFEDAGSSDVAQIKEDYENCDLDYVGVKSALNALDMDDLSDDDVDLVLEIQEAVEEDYADMIAEMADSGDYVGMYRELYGTVEALEGDAFAVTLMETYESDYIIYLDEECTKLAEDDKLDEALEMLEEARLYVSDEGIIDDLMDAVEKAANGDSDYILPDSDKRYLTMADVEDLTLQEINYAKNEIYARHGRRFNSAELQNYFDSKSWYNGTISPGSFSSSVFNQYESKNAEFLSEVEFARDSRGYQLDQ